MLKTWTKFEKVWLFLFAGVILAMTVIFSIGGTNYQDWHSVLLNWVISPVSALTGIVCVLLCAKGNKWNYVWGTVNCLTYGYLAYFCGYYGDMLLNLGYFLPFQLIGYIWWNKHLRNGSNNTVIMRRLNWKQAVGITAGGIVATGVFGYLLTQLDGWFFNVMKRNQSIYEYIDNIFHVPFLGAIFDASTETLQVIAQILMTLAFVEQWILWILVNIITIIMWITVIVADPTSIAWAMPTLLMWVAYLVNSVYGYINWLRGAKNV